jgi:hypothetical protein
MRLVIGAKGTTINQLMLRSSSRIAINQYTAISTRGSQGLHASNGAIYPSAARDFLVITAEEGYARRTTRRTASCARDEVCEITGESSSRSNVDSSSSSSFSVSNGIIEQRGAQQASSTRLLRPLCFEARRLRGLSLWK